MYCYQAIPKGRRAEAPEPDFSSCSIQRHTIPQLVSRVLPSNAGVWLTQVQSVISAGPGEATNLPHSLGSVRGGVPWERFVRTWFLAPECCGKTRHSLPLP